MAHHREAQRQAHFRFHVAASLRCYWLKKPAHVHHLPQGTVYKTRSNPGQAQQDACCSSVSPTLLCILSKVFQAVAAKAARKATIAAGYVNDQTCYGGAIPYHSAAN